MENFWNKRYESDDYVYGISPNCFLREFASKLPKGRILALGEGEGRNAVYLASKGYEVLALDQSSVARKKALKLAAQKKVSLDYCVTDACEFPLLETGWAGIYSIFMHMPYTVRVRMHQRVVQALRPGGVFLALYYTPEQLNYGTGGPPQADWMASAENLKMELKGLRFELLKETEMELVEGKSHSGRASVVQCIAIKD